MIGVEVVGAPVAAQGGVAVAARLGDGAGQPVARRRRLAHRQEALDELLGRPVLGHLRVQFGETVPQRLPLPDATNRAKRAKRGSTRSVFGFLHN